MIDAAPTPSSRRIIALGEIVGTHGIRGLLRFHPYDDAGALTAPRTVQLAPRSSPSSEPTSVRLLSVARHGRVLLLRVEDVDSIEAAEPLVGTVLAIPEDDLPAAAPGEFYVYQLEGLDVLTVDGERLGTVTRVFPTGSNEVLVVEDGEREHLIPLIQDVVRTIDLDARRIVIAPIDGLLA